MIEYAFELNAATPVSPPRVDSLPPDRLLKGRKRWRLRMSPLRGSLDNSGLPPLVALILGKLRRTGPMLWTMPLPANIVLRNYGLAIFLAAVGINAGQPFVKTVSETGLSMLFIGVAVLLTTVIIVLLVGYYLMKIPYDDLVGIASGATGNPAILVYSTRMAPTERPDIGYAMIFPSMTILKVIAVQIVGLLALAPK